jgi:hypothetical protein
LGALIQIVQDVSFGNSVAEHFRALPIAFSIRFETAKAGSQLWCKGQSCSPRDDAGNKTLWFQIAVFIWFCCTGRKFAVRSKTSRLC